MSSPNQLSFLPDDYLERKARRRTNVICVGLFVIIVGSVFFAAVLAERSLKDVDAREREVNARYTEAARRIDQVKQLNEKQQQMARQAELTDSLIERVPRSNLLAEIRQSMPEGMTLMDLSMESTVRQTGEAAAKPKLANPSGGKAAAAAAAAEPPRPRQYDVKLKLTGIADTDVQVAQFISKLNTSKLLQDVNLLISDEFKLEKRDGRTSSREEGPVMRKFQMEMALRPDAEIKPAEGDNGTAVKAVEEASTETLEKEDSSPIARARKATAAANDSLQNKTAAVDQSE